MRPWARSTLIAESNRRFCFTYLSNRDAPFYTASITGAGEAAHVIDGLLYHEKIIAAHWDDVMRLACSVRPGVVSAPLMLKRFGNYPRQNRLALALREVGRSERPLHVNWLEQSWLRRQTTTALNQAESRNAPGNALARTVCFHRLGRLRDCTVNAQQHRASGLALVTAAIALWNTVYLGRALDLLRRRGEVIPDAMLAHLAPLGWQHINLIGDYLWNAGSTFGSDGFRPLRATSADPIAVAA